MEQFDGEEAAYKKNYENEGKKVEIFIYEWADWFAFPSEEASDEEKSCRPAYYRCDDKAGEKDTRDSGGDCANFVGQGCESCGEDDPEVVFII